MQRIVKQVLVEVEAAVSKSGTVYIASTSAAKQRAEEKAIADYIKEHGLNQIDWKNVAFEFVYQYRIVPIEVPELAPGKAVEDGD